MERFEISNIIPTGHATLWKADVAVRTPETIDGIEVGQNAILTVRFAYPDDGSVSGMLDAAVRKAEQCLASASEALSGRSAADLLAEFRASIESSNKPFEIPTDWQA